MQLRFLVLRQTLYRSVVDQLLLMLYSCTSYSSRGSWSIVAGDVINLIKGLLDNDNWVDNAKSDKRMDKLRLPYVFCAGVSKDEFNSFAAKLFKNYDVTFCNYLKLILLLPDPS